MKKSLEPTWLPNRFSWLKALLMALLMTAIIHIVRITGSVGYVLTRFADSPETFVIFGILAGVAPIPAIAFVHHLLPVFLSRFAPTIPPHEIGINRELIPKLTSWWEGLYGWLVLVLSTLITTVICTLVLPFFHLSYEKIRLGSNRWAEIELLAWLAVIWIVNAAEFYQIEDVFKRNIIAINSVRSKATNSSLNLILKPDTEQEQLQSEFGSSQIKTERANPPRPMRSERETQPQPQKLAKKLLIPLLIVWVASGIYGFAKWSELQEETSAPLSPQSQAATQKLLGAKTSTTFSSAPPVTSETPLPVPYAPPVLKPTGAIIQEPPPLAEFEPFQQAVYKAMSAANLTQLAQSQGEWKAIARQWTSAIALMKSVPQSSPHYEQAQSKAIEYQQNLDYALKVAATRSK